MSEYTGDQWSASIHGCDGLVWLTIKTKERFFRCSMNPGGAMFMAADLLQQATVAAGKPIPDQLWSEFVAKIRGH